MATEGEFVLTPGSNILRAKASGGSATRVTLDFSQIDFTALNEKIAECMQAWMAFMADVGNALQRIVEAWERITYRQRLERWVADEPPLSRWAWRSWIWLMDHTGYHWEGGPEPW